ncbi:uncharacterized protein LOC110810690 [Carica papaya]|uniref:uncharacterized protein LOC110810690 n=1 Tax=Carica papaya TaxID=3649 RepID=UPI000B8CF088|nr:uncharacterized protein LOC110810690 [Carica papaya]
MTRQILIRSPPVNRRQPLLSLEETNSTPGRARSPAEKKKKKKKGRKLGEMAGGAAAECAAVCCCCPCTVMNLLVLAVYRLPSGLCKKAWKKRLRQRRKRQNGLLVGDMSLSRESGSWPSGIDLETEVKRVADGDGDGAIAGVGDCETEAVDLDKEMWDRFCGTGFWRSPSQREEGC